MFRRLDMAMENVIHQQSSSSSSALSEPLLEDLSSSPIDLESIGDPGDGANARPAMKHKSEDHRIPARAHDSNSAIWRSVRFLSFSVIENRFSPKSEWRNLRVSGRNLETTSASISSMVEPGCVLNSYRFINDQLCIVILGTSSQYDSLYLQK